MHQQADAIVTVPPDADWTGIREAARPGCFLAAVQGTAPHRATAAIEQAGWQVRDCLLWLRPDRYETVVLAMRPLDGTVVQNVQRYGTGALNVDACRIETDDDLNGGAYSERTRDLDEFFPKARLPGAFVQPGGRWPPNLLMSHGPDCTDERCGSDCPVGWFDAMCPDAGGQGPPGLEYTTRTSGPGWFMSVRDGRSGPVRYNKWNCGASRFYPRFRHDPARYPVEALAWLLRLIVPPGDRTVLVSEPVVPACRSLALRYRRLDA